LPFAHVPTDNYGRMDPAALEKMLAAGDVGCIVATEGTTGTGSVDPLPEILRLRERYGFRLHVDAAYGGYFTLASNLTPETRASFDLIGRADSIVIDPHKHGLQPYGCGCVLFRDPQVGAIYKHESPYTYFTSSELHLGEISLECSRPGASAVALWATQRLLPLTRRGEFAAMLEASRHAAVQFAQRLVNDERWMLPFAPELDIVVWAPRAGTVAEISATSQRIFDAATKQNLHLALVHVPIKFFSAQHNLQASASDTVLCLRSVLMKPEHRDWLDRICAILSRAADSVAGPGS
jgi:tyrosine decarboxylase/aspartate 1-decarboxylase